MKWTDCLPSHPNCFSRADDGGPNSSCLMMNGLPGWAAQETTAARGEARGQAGLHLGLPGSWGSRQVWKSEARGRGEARVRNMKAARKSKQSLPWPPSIDFTWGRSPPQREMRAGPRQTARVVMNELT